MRKQQCKSKKDDVESINCAYKRLCETEKFAMEMYGLMAVWGLWVILFMFVFAIVLTMFLYIPLWFYQQFVGMTNTTEALMQRDDIL